MTKQEWGGTPAHMLFCLNYGIARASFLQQAWLKEDLHEETRTYPRWVTESCAALITFSFLLGEQRTKSGRSAMLSAFKDRSASLRCPSMGLSLQHHSYRSCSWGSPGLATLCTCEADRCWWLLQIEQAWRCDISWCEGKTVAAYLNSRKPCEQLQHAPEASSVVFRQWNDHKHSSESWKMCGGRVKGEICCVAMELPSCPSHRGHEQP